MAYVLVHGAWHGAWCWQRVRDALTPDGPAVHAPSLTGLGERAQLVSREVGLETHVADVLGVLESEDLSGVVLVGHSYAGLVISAVADRAPARIARLVYLDAIVARDGESFHDRVPLKLKARFEEQAAAAGEGWLIPTAVATAQFLGLKDEADARWVLPRLTPHPIKTFRDPLRLSPAFPQVPRSYVNCIGDKPPGQPRTLQAEGIEDYHELRTGHDAMVSAPAEIAALLRRLAG